MNNPELLVLKMIRQALKEDVGSGDLTAQLISPLKQGNAFVVSREHGVLCGCDWFEATFLALDASIVINWLQKDGSTLIPNQPIVELKGPARSLLTGERTALNFLQTLSGVASITRLYNEAIKPYTASLIDTRKTIPGWRLAQKYAVRVGGGINHRMGLFDAILIKENHIALAGSVKNALMQAKQLAPSGKFVQIEVETLEQLSEALEHGAKMVLLDNMSHDQLKEAVLMNNKRAILEASGGITLQNIQETAATGVDRISVGRLTKDIQAIDYSMRLSIS
jgi:nicotinate-nucleotide pyrophosphorylase (carboxylating)